MAEHTRTHAAAPPQPPTGAAARPTPPYPGVTDPGSAPSATGLPPGLAATTRAFGAALAPPTAVVGLAVYFAVQRQEALALHFGVDTSVLGYSVQDYLQRAGEPLFVVALVLLSAALAAVWAHRALLRRLASPSAAASIRRATLPLAGVGALLCAVGGYAVFRPLPGSPPFLVRTLSLGLGACFLAYGLWLRQHTAPRDDTTPPWLSSAGVVLVAALVALSVLWTTEEVAEALGRGQAAVLAANLASRPGVVVYSRDDLHLDGPGVGRQVVEDGGDGADAVYRYDGLRLLVRSGGRYLLLPSGWTRAEGAALVLAEDALLRVEFTPAGR